MKKMRIADINIDMEYTDKQRYNNQFRKYEYDRFVEQDMILKTRYLNEIVKPAGKTIKQIHDATIVHIGDNRYCRYLMNSQNGEIMCAVYYNDIYDEVEINLSKGMGPDALCEYEYIYSGAAFRDRLTELGGATLHGSAVAYEGQGIVFSANSGIGKSTHANLWLKRFGNKVTIINDDKPAIRFYDKIPYVFGTPWSGKTNRNTNTQVPLKSVVFIKRAETNRVERISAKESIFSLMSQISRPYYDERIGLKTMETIKGLVLTVPIYNLYCNTDINAADTIYQYLIRERVIQL